MIPSDYVVLAFGFFMSSCAVPFAFVKRTGSLDLTQFLAAFWTVVTIFFPAMIISLVGRGLNVTIFDPPPGPALLLLSFLAALLPVAVYFRLMGQGDRLTAIAILASILSFLVGSLPVVGLVSFREIAGLFDPNLGMAVFMIGLVLAVMSIVNISLGLSVYEEERKRSLMRRCLAFLKAKSRATFNELQSGIQARDLKALSDALNHLMDEGEVTAQEEGGKTYFVPDSKPEA